MAWVHLPQDINEYRTRKVGGLGRSTCSDSHSSLRYNTGREGGEEFGVCGKFEQLYSDCTKTGGTLKIDSCNNFSSALWGFYSSLISF